MATARMPSANAARKSRSRRRRVERRDDLAVRADALVDLDHALVQQGRQLDAAHEELRPVLVADAQRIARSRA